ncbi:MAG: dienelactone hydrolase family protein [Dehalococcoidia bacterium]
MCFPFNAQPPIIPVAGAAADAEHVTLTSSDGTEFAAFAARASEPGRPGIVVLPDVRGLFRFYEELALRFAEQGISAVAIDYFGRTAGVGTRDESFPFMEHVAQTRPEQVAGDVGAAVRYLRSEAGGSSSPIFTVGFCFGGAQSWLQAANGHGLAGVIGFYGGPGPGRDGSPGPAQRAREFACPVLALMAGADQWITPDQVDVLRRALEDAGVENEVVVYPDAPHSFFDRSFEEHAEASADAWQRMLAFIHQHSGEREAAHA